ncbi:MAG: hypothetical protein ACLU9S_03965 [Oscillospiraceae bacterium]
MEVLDQHLISGEELRPLGIQRQSVGLECIRNLHAAPVLLSNGIRKGAEEIQPGQRRLTAPET